MTGLASGGISFGALVLPPLMTHLINAYGWRTTYFIIGVTVLVMMTIGVQFLKTNPNKWG